MHDLALTGSRLIYTSPVSTSRRHKGHLPNALSKSLLLRPCWKPSRAFHSQARHTSLHSVPQAFWNSGSGQAADPLRGVNVVVERAERNSRRLYAAVQIAAPVETVWGALTDYEGLGNFIPGLSENRCLSKSPTGATLLQIGEQDVAFGAKFRARVVLDIQEHSAGTPKHLCSFGTGVADEQLFPLPRAATQRGPYKDVSFSMIEGDFQAFRGIWRMHPGVQGPDSCQLSYSLFVRPQIWLPVRLIQSRIEGEVRSNLAAVRNHSEGLCRERSAGNRAKQI